MLADILAAARLRNARRDITGMLLYRDGVFLQLLEGSRVEVDLVLAAIRRDTRHRRLTVLVGRTDHRTCVSGWSMGYHALRKQDLGAGRRTAKDDGRHRARCAVRADAPVALHGSDEP